MEPEYLPTPPPVSDEENPDYQGGFPEHNDN